MDLQFGMEIFLPRNILNSNFFVNPFSSDVYWPHNVYTIMQVITTYVHYSAGADELASMEIGFLPRRISSLTLSVLS